MPSRPLRLAQLLVLLLLLLLPSTTAAPDAVTATINFTQLTSPPIAPNFVSFSLEVSQAQNWLGSNTSQTKASILTLLSSLSLTPNAPGLSLRIGGNSADTSWWNPSHLPRPVNITYDIQPLDILVVTHAVQALNGTAVFGLNFRRGSNSSWAVAHAKGIDAYGDWSRTTMEIGNECDLYGGNAIRQPGYNYSQYDTEWAAYARDIAAAVLNAPAKAFQGATFASSSWYRNLTSYAAEHRAQLATVSVHTYPTTHCNGNNVTIAQLLVDSASQSEAALLTSLSLPSNLTALNTPLQIGEGNSASCGGMPGVSNVFASALWAIDELYNMAAAGLRGFNFHGGSGGFGSTQSYSALVYNTSSSQQPLVQPLFYGVSMFAMGTRNYPHTVNTTIAQTTNPLIKVHATWDGSRMAVMIIHKDSSKNESATVVLAFPAPAGFVFPVAQVRRLEAGGLGISEQYNLTLAGRTWWGTAAGEMLGTEVVEQAAATRQTSSGQYTVVVRPASAVLLEWTVLSSSVPSSTSAAAFSDPRFRGFWGQSFYVSGAVGGVYSLLTSPQLQLNARFTYLRNISCPHVDGHDVSNCFQEEGTYFGSMALRVQGGHWLSIVGGAVADGFASVQLNDKHTLKVGDSVSVGQPGATDSPSTSRARQQLSRLQRGQPQRSTGEQPQRRGAAAPEASVATSSPPALSVSRPSDRTLRVQAGDYVLQIDNMDGYVDITALDVACWACLEQGRMQLDGLLGQTWNPSAVILQSEEEVEAFRVQGDDLLGCQHMHDRFCHSAV